MKVGNQPLPVSARVPFPPSSHRTPRQSTPDDPDTGTDRVAISREASAAVAAARAGVPTGLSGTQIRELIAESNREASKTPSQAGLERILALIR
jgi:hypothetical protein